jgi:plasmid maintenance system antidote protein VapI
MKNTTTTSETPPDKNADMRRDRRLVSPLERVRELEAEIAKVETEHRFNVQLALGRIPKRIKDLRREKGLKQYRLADVTGLSRPQIANIEAGRSQITVEALLQIAIILETTPDVLLGLRANDPGMARRPNNDGQPDTKNESES